MNADFTDRDMWIAIRAGLLGIVKALEVHGDDSELTEAIRAGLLGIADAIGRRYNLRNKNNKV